MFFAMVKKEFLLVLRDKHALLALFVMPAIFILIMSVALKEQFNQDAISFNISLNDLDESNLSKKIITKLEEDKSFNIIRDEKDADLRVSIPKGYSVDDLKKEMKLNIIVKSSMKSDLLEIFKSKLLKTIVSLKLEYVKESFKQFSPKAVEPLDAITLSSKELFNIKYDKIQNIPNSTQQSVPTWIVFGMFFVIIPMSTIFIKERKQNTLIRLNSMNISIFSMTISKIIPYLIINHIQVWIMIAVGMFVVPFFDTPALEINGSVFALIVLSVSLSISAIGLSTLIAVSATSSEQATTIGGILNILLGAIGGVMVPKFIMPESMQRLADISPMSWGLDGFLDIFIRNGDLLMVAKESILLLLFGTTSLIISMIILRIRIRKGL